MQQKKIKSSWSYLGEQDFNVPEGALGFVYKIEIIGTPYYYYGKKNLFSVKGRGKKAVTKESTWRSYESSSKELKQLIKDGAKIQKTILQFCYSKAQLSMQETKVIICNGALEDPNCLNRWIMLKVWEHQLK